MGLSDNKKISQRASPEPKGHFVPPFQQQAAKIQKMHIYVFFKKKGRNAPKSTPSHYERITDSYFKNRLELAGFVHTANQINNFV